MDHSYSVGRMMKPSGQAVATGARIVSYLHGGGRLVVVTGSAGCGKTSLLDLVLDGMPARVLRARNVGPGALSIESVAAQVGAEPVDGDAAAGLLAMLLERAHGEGPSVLAVDDAHTLSQGALSLLARVPGLGGPDLPGAILMLAGEKRLQELLASPGLDRLRNPATTLAVHLPAPNEAAPAEPTTSPGVEVSGVEEVERAPILSPLAALGVGAAALALVLALLFRPLQAGISHLSGLSSGGDGSAMAATAPLVPGGARAGTEVAEGGLSGIHAEPPPMVTAGVTAGTEAAVVRPESPAGELPAGPDAWDRGPAAGPAPVPAAGGGAQPAAAEVALAPAAPVAAGDASLRRGFDAFLNRAGQDTALLTAEARESLFREYLGWRARGGGVRAGR